MKDFKQLLKKKTVGSHAPLDEKSVFYVFHMVMKEEYGKQGLENFKPLYYRNSKIFVSDAQSALAKEIWQKRGELVMLINKQLGIDEIKDIILAK